MLGRSILVLSMLCFFQGCKTQNGASDTSSVVEQPRANSPKVNVYKANTQNIKKYECASQADAKKLDKNCTTDGSFVLINDFRAEVANVGLSSDEGDAILAALRLSALKDDDVIKESGNPIDGAKIRKVFKNLFAQATPPGGGGGGTPPGGGGFVMPTIGKKNNPVAKAEVITAWKALKKNYYESSAIYTKKGSSGGHPPAAEIINCLGACPDNWSDLACHYYSHTPSYEQVIPNIRGCFTRVARGAIMKGSTKLTYPETYDYCVFQDFDAVLGRAPPYNQKEIDKNKKAGNRPGVMAWIDVNQPDAFKYIMFPDGFPFTWDKAQEQETINEFYGVDLKGKTSYSATDKAQVDECTKKRAMTGYDPRDGTHCSYTKVSTLQTHP